MKHSWCKGCPHKSNCAYSNLNCYNGYYRANENKKACDVRIPIVNPTPSYSMPLLFKCIEPNRYPISAEYDIKYQY